MHNIREVTDGLYWVGGNDRRLALFENIHPLYHGVSYNSYLLMDEKTVLFDTADWAVGRQFVENVKAALNGRSLDYLVINHVEPDHAASLEEILLRWPDVNIITSSKAVVFLRQFGFSLDSGKVREVKEGDTASFGRHEVVFLTASMVHWPEVLMTYDKTNGVLFSADAFGSFGSLDGKLFADEYDFDGEWIDDARRYYANIVGKYGPQVSTVLKKAAGLDIKYICPLHGPVWRASKDGSIPYFLEKYQHWASYTPEEKGIMIVYASMYGGTENAAELLASKLADRGIFNTKMYDVSSTHVSYLISDLFKYSHLVIASVTYNLGIFPPMHNFLSDIKALNLQNRTCAVIWNGTWAPKAGDLIRDSLAGLKKMELLEEGFLVNSTFQKQNQADLEALADALKMSLEKE